LDLVQMAVGPVKQMLDWCELSADLLVAEDPGSGWEFDLTDEEEKTTTPVKCRPHSWGGEVVWEIKVKISGSISVKSLNGVIKHRRAQRQ